MNNIKVSVIIPCYNGWKYMNKCLGALERQTIVPYEVIIVDDCSTDDSYDQLKKYTSCSALNIRLIKNAKNSGPGVSRRSAVNLATGDYLAFCDCDDWYEDTFIQEMTEKVKEYTSDMVICDSYTAFDNRRYQQNIIKPLIGATKKEIIVLYATSLCRLMVKKELFDNVCCPAIYHMEDGAVVPQLMAKAENIAVLDKPLYNYYFREDSASNKPSQRVFSDLIAAFTAVAEIKDEYPDEYEFLGIRMVCYGSTLNAFKAGIKIKNIHEEYKDFLKEHPVWKKNKYLHSYNRFKRMYLTALSYYLYPVCKAMASVHFVITKNRIR